MLVGTVAAGSGSWLVGCCAVVLSYFILLYDYLLVTYIALN
jgi:hypothetical protein